MISVIVPVYNVEKYLVRCVESLLNQIGEIAYEIVLVDDGSTDSSGLICDGFKTKFPEKIRCLHKENGGLSDARNKGIDISCGEWLLFVDSDDYVSCDLLANLTKEVCGDVDIVTSRFAEVTEDGVILKPSNQDDEAKKVLSGADAAELLTNELYSYITAWGKLYRRSLFSEVRYPLRLIHEDEAVQCPLFLRARSVVIGDFVGYFYVQRSGSIMRTEDFNGKANYVDAIFIRLIDEFRFGKMSIVEKDLHALVFAIIRLFNEAKTRQEKTIVRKYFSAYDKAYEQRKAFKVPFHERKDRLISSMFYRSKIITILVLGRRYRVPSTKTR